MPVPEQVEKQIREAEDALNTNIENTQPDEAQSTESVESTEQVAQVQDATPVAQSEDWEHKYRVLQGKYNAEVPRLHQQVKQLAEENDFFKKKLELLESMVQEKFRKEETSTVDDPDLKTLQEDYPDIYKGVQKLLQKYTPKEIAPKEDTKTQEMVFFTLLKQNVPDWEILNYDPDFLAWLSQPEGYSNMTRHQLMLDAFNRKDVHTVANYFNAYKNEKAQQAQKKSSVSQQNISPPVGRASSPSGSPKPTLTQADVEKFYRDLALGRIPKEEAKKFEKEIVMAMKEGRFI